MCAVTPSNRSCNVSRNPVFIDNAITSVATPAATPTIENSVTSRSTAGRYGDRKYLRATNHSNRIDGIFRHAQVVTIMYGAAFLRVTKTRYLTEVHFIARWPSRPSRKNQ